MHRLVSCLLILSCLSCSPDKSPNVSAPDNMIGNWLNPKDNTWQYGFFKHFAVVDGQFWDYKQVISRGNITLVRLSKKDSVQTLELTKKGKDVLVVNRNSSSDLVSSRYNENSDFGNYDTIGFKAPLIRKGEFSVSGVLNGYNFKKDNFKFATIIYNSLLEQTQPNFIADLDSLGRFQANIPLLHPQEVMIKFGSQLIEIYAIPGRSVMIHVNKDQNTEPITTKEMVSQISRRAEILFAGELGRLNTERNDHVFNTWKTVNVISYSRNLQNMNESEFKMWRKRAEATQLEDMFRFAEKHHASKSFVQLMKTRITYACADDLLRYQFDIERNIKLSEQYLSFLSADLLNSPHAVLSDNYSSFINLYRKLKLPNGDSPVYLLSDKFLKEGISGDVLLSNYVFRMIKYRYPISQKEQKVLLSRIKLPAIRQEVAENLGRYNSVEKVAEQTNPSNIQGRQEELLQSLVSKYKGRVVYIDFWGTWCAPCIDEMPASQSLRNQLSNKDFVFLYLAVNSPENVWKRMIKDKSLKGEHRSLNTGEYELLSNLFQVGGLPHYAIVDKEGNIVNRNAKRPSKMKELKTELNLYL